MRSVAIFAAMTWECRPILRQLGAARKGDLDGMAIWRAELPHARVLVVRTGIGLERASRAALAVCEEERVDAFLSSGCAGALAGDLEPGHIVIAESIRLAGETPLLTHAPERDRAFAAAHRTGIPTRAGALLSSPEALAKVADKRAALATGVIAVEMEGASIARVAIERDIPFAAVRSILDAADMDVVSAPGLIDPGTGGVRPLAVVRHLVRNPGALGKMAAMKKLMDASESSLARFFAEYLSNRE